MSFGNIKSVVLLTLALCWITACGGGGGAIPVSQGGTAAPEAPVSITADPGVSSAGLPKVTLTWSNVTSVASFIIYYRKSPGVTKTNGTKIEDAHSPHVLRDLADPAGTTYYFSVASVGPGGEGGLSAEVSAILSLTPPPAAPINVRAAAGDGQVQVSWEPSSGATSYTVYYRSAPQVTKTDSHVHSAASPGIVAALTNGTAYYFAVSATNANGEGALSFEAGATPLASPPPPVPTGLTAVEGNGQITLNWNPSAGATAYSIYYGTQYGVTKGNGIQISPVTAPKVITSLTNKTAYFFVVTASNVNGESPESAKVSATPLAAKSVPVLVPIPAGSFTMGYDLEPSAAPYAAPEHDVLVDAFYMDRYETTYDLWKEVYDWALANGYDFDNNGRNGFFGIGTNLPVTGVNWYDVVKWLNARSEKETAAGGSRTPVYYTDATQSLVYRTGRVAVTNDSVKWNASGYRLPTSAEWEKAARGGLTGKLYPWGDEALDPSRANYNMGLTTSVGSYDPNGYGLYDMAGNVTEWTWDWSSDNYIWAIGIVNPHGPDTGAYKVRRGGTFAYPAKYLRCYERESRPITYTGPYFGFRSVSNQP